VYFLHWIYDSKLFFVKLILQAGERLRITYDKKCVLLRHQDSKGEDPQLVDKTRAAIKSLHTGIKVSIQAIDSVSKRIQKLRDEELQPQLVELIQGYAFTF
jgi:hypothetical protein